jgi:hypothetical protein
MIQDMSGVRSWRTVLLLPFGESVVKMIAGEVEEVAKYGVALWTGREMIALGFREPVDPQSHEGGTREWNNKIGCHCGAEF